MDDFKMVDRAEAIEVEVMISDDGRLWVNLDGKCLLRVQKPSCIRVIMPDGEEYVKERIKFNAHN